MSQPLGPQHYNFLTVMGAFPAERLKRCGATPAQIATEQATWNSHDIHWQAQEAMNFHQQPDSVIASWIAAFPPAIPASISASWPYT